MKVGPTFTLQRFEMDNATLGFYGVASAAILGGSLYQGSLGLGKQLRVALNARSRVILTIEGREELYLDSPLRPTVVGRQRRALHRRGDLRAPAHAGASWRSSP